MVLFVCSLGKLRSRTAELLCLFGGLDARACGTAPDALAPVTDGLLREADLVVCMESTHKRALKDFQHYGACETVTLGVEDNYDRLEPELVSLLCYQVRFHSPQVADAMERGAAVLHGLPGYALALGTQTPRPSSNPAISAFPSF
jgi:predicted protein tyrosine phosphatase